MKWRETIMGRKKQLVVGDRVIKTGGDYVFQGYIVSVFRKVKGQIRYVVENDDGILHIFSPTQLVTLDDGVPETVEFNVSDDGRDTGAG